MVPPPELAQANVSSLANGQIEINGHADFFAGRSHPQTYAETGRLDVLPVAVHEADIENSHRSFLFLRTVAGTLFWNSTESTTGADAQIRSIRRIQAGMGFCV